MPRLRTERDPYEDYVGLILQRMRAEELDLTSLAERIGISRQTLRAYLRDPGSMRLDTVRKVHRVLGIRAEQARDRIPMW